MDLRQILDVGASPQAPPGKITEPPPKAGEFEKALKTVKKEQNPGEVAENEPNAQLQKLDSKEKTTEAETSDDCASLQTAIPISIEPTVTQLVSALPLVQMMVTSVVTPVTPSVPTQLPISVSQFVTEPLKGFGNSEPIPSNLKATSSMVSVEDESQLDATQNSAITVMVEKAFGLSPTKGSSANAASLLQTFTKSEGQIAGAGEPIVSKEVQIALNINSVKSSATSTGSSTQQAETQNPLGLAVVQSPATVNKDVDVKPKLTESTTALVASVAEPVTASNNTESKDSGSKEKSKDNPGPAIQVPQSTPLQLDNPIKADSVEGRQLTTTERQAAIEVISRKIDELAANSVRNEVRVEMHPPELGSVVVNLRKDLACITATLNASNEPLRQALHDSRNDLAASLADRNVGQVRIEVRSANADTMNMGQQFNQAQSQQQQQHQQQSHQARMSANAFNRSNRDEAPEPQATHTRVSTTLLDLEI